MHIASSARVLATFSICILVGACGPADDHGHSHSAPSGAAAAESAADHDMEHGMDHEHDEVALGTFPIGEHAVALSQGHGAVEPGKESHLVIKLPFQDGGATVVRAWIGTQDRTLSLVGKADYAASHDDYDVHVTAPDTLSEGSAWWVEIERPDGTTAVGSAPYLRE